MADKPHMELFIPGSPKPAEWHGLTNNQIKAAHLVVEDALTGAQIAAACGISERQLTRWKRRPEFIALTRHVIAKFDEQLLAVGVGTRRRRVEALNERWHRMNRVIEARSSDPSAKEIIGGDTGLMVKQYKGIGRGEDFQILTEYAVDTGMLREMREIEKQAAIELGQWSEGAPPDPAIPANTPINVLINISTAPVEPRPAIPEIEKSGVIDV